MQPRKFGFFVKMGMLFLLVPATWALSKPMTLDPSADLLVIPSPQSLGSPVHLHFRAHQDCTYAEIRIWGISGLMTGHVVSISGTGSGDPSYVLRSPVKANVELDIQLETSGFQPGSYSAIANFTGCTAATAAGAKQAKEKSAGAARVKFVIQ